MENVCGGTTKEVKVRIVNGVVNFETEQETKDMADGYINYHDLYD